MHSTIVVIGSSNTDMVIKTDRLPAPGETVIGGQFFMNAGGKGANQAVAAARLGGKVLFIAKTGNDIFATRALELLEQEKIDISYMVSDPRNPSGVALILVDKNAENCIAVASGANATLFPADLAAAKAVIQQAAIVLLQLEIPIETVEYVTAVAAEAGVSVILNPAPMCFLPDALLGKISLLTPNASEAGMLAGMEVTDIGTAKKAAMLIHKKGVRDIIITLGAQGALVSSSGFFSHIPAVEVKAVDTTAAGDVFNGALAVAITGGLSLAEAASFACRASAISVTRLGAQSSAPYKNEMESLNLMTS